MLQYHYWESDVHVIIQYEKLLSGIFHNVLAEVVNEKGDIRRPAILVCGRY